MDDHQLESTWRGVVTSLANDCITDVTAAKTVPNSSTSFSPHPTSLPTSPPTRHYSKLAARHYSKLAARYSSQLAMSTKVSKKIDEKSDVELPEARKGKVVRHDIQLPLQNTPLSTVIYGIAAALVLYLAYYIWIFNSW